MAGVSSDININVKANVKGATSQINAAGDAVRDFGKRTQTANQNVKVFGKNLTGAGGGNKFFRSGLQQTGYQLGDFAVQVGGGTNALQAFGQQAPQLLQIFGPLGSIIGAAVAIFAAVGVAIMKTGDSAEEAKSKIDNMHDSLSALNSAARDVGKTFRVEVASSFEEAKAKFGEMSDGVKIFIENQRKIKLQSLTEGAQGLRDVFRDLVPSGQVDALKDLSIYLEKNAVSARKRATNVEAINKIIEGTTLRMANAVGNKAIVAIDALILKFQAQVEAGKDTSAVLLEINTQANELPAPMKKAFHAVGGLGERLNTLAVEMSAYAGQADQAKSSTIELSAAIASMETFSMDSSELAPLGVALAIQREINVLLKQGMEQTEATAEATRLLSGDLAANSALLQARLAAERKITDELTKQAKVRKPEDMRGFSTGAIPIPQASPVTQDYLKELGKINLQIAQITEKQRLMNELGLSKNVAQQAAKIATTLKLTDAQFALLVERLKKLEDSSQEAGKELKDAFDKISSSFKSAFKSVIDGTKSVSEAFRDMMGEILSSLMDKSIDAALDGLFDKLSGAGGAGGGDGLWGLLEKGFSYLGGLLSAPATSGDDVGGLIEPLAKGGYASATRPYLVGEMGPELMIPSASGRVVPNDELGGSGSQINQTFNVSTGVQQTVRAEIQSLMPQIAAASTQAVLDARRRGGSFAGAFA